MQSRLDEIVRYVDARDHPSARRARAPDVHHALRRSRADLQAAVREGDVTATHPALGVINVYQWVLFVGQHEERHTRQVAEIVRRLM